MSQLDRTNQPALPMAAAQPPRGGFWQAIKNRLRRYTDRPMVRPLALAGPVLVLLIALPLLRPLRHPSEMSDDEVLRFATIRALVEHHSLSLDHDYAGVHGAVTARSGVYSAQPPMMALLLSAPAWVMNRLGLSFDNNQLLIEYLLTVLGVTLPVAGAAGLIYRMGRLFELRRVWRTGLGIAVVAGSGLLSYAVVLNPFAPSATLVLGCAACLVHVAAMNRDDRRAGWFALAGACAALATTLDPAALVLLILFLCVIPTMRFSVGRRIAGVMLYLLGATPVIALHAAWNIPVTGDAIPAVVHIALDEKPSEVAPITSVAARDEFGDDEDEQPTRRSWWDATGSTLMWLLEALVGEHGLLSHFPVMILGIAGIGAVMHRHWPGSTKTLAAATGVGALLIILLYRYARADWGYAMFASKWFILFTPMLLFWAGAWLRRVHSGLVWGLAATVLLFSIGVGLIGATDPTPRRGYDRYTAAGALFRLLQAQSPAGGTAIAGRSG